jgi:hypothetical protein
MEQETAEDPITLEVGRSEPPAEPSTLACDTKERRRPDDSQHEREHVNNDYEITQRLNRELALSKSHRHEIESHWRQILRKEKYKELHEEIAPLSEYHEQNVERKKEVIKSTQHEFDYLQELYRKAMVANIVRMDEFITIHDDQVILLESDFRERVELLQNEFRREVERINAQYDREKEAVRQCIQKQQQKNEYMAELLKQDTQHELEEIKNRNLEDVNSLRFTLDSKIEDLEEQFEQANFDYAQSTDFTKAAYEQLKAKDTEMRKEIQQKARRADRLQNEIQRFQLIARQEEAHNRERHQALLERKARAIHKFQMTKDEMARFRKDQQQKLVVLSRRANEKKEALKRQCVVAERVKKIAMACTKWETSREQFASLLRDSIESTSDQGSTPASQSQANSIQCVKKLDINQLSNQSILLQNSAHRFWDKYNMVQLDVMTLEKRVDGLKRKEKDLRRKLKMYQDGISVNDDVLKNRNPLLVINGKMNTVQDNSKLVNGRKVSRRLTVVDANHIFATHNMAK